MLNNATLVPPRRPTAVSQILRALRDEIENTPRKWNFTDELGVRYRILVASSRADHERAYHLAYRVYRGCGYVPNQDGRELLVSDYDARPGTFTLLIEDAAGKAIATATLVGDTGGLPGDEIYGEELDALRGPGRRLVEVTRLCIDPEYQRCKVVLVYLFNFLFIHGVRNQGYTDCVIEVTPSHAGYYRRLLAFEPLGQERACPRVNGTLGILLHLDWEVYDREVKRVGGTHNSSERSLYSYFHSYAEEAPIARFLAQQHQPMTPEERAYFHLNSPMDHSQAKMELAVASEE